MIHIMKKIADWIVQHEEKEAENCSIPDEIIDEWLDTIKEREQRMQDKHKHHSEQLEMLKDLEERVNHIKDIRDKKCHTPQNS